MKVRALVAMLGVALSLSACQMNDATSAAARPGTMVAVSTEKAGSTEKKVGNREFSVQAVNVTVPERLVVSEADVYYPIADIVWRGEPRGDRYAQVKAIFEEAMALGTRNLTSGQQAVVDIEVTRFHAVTEKTRYSIGGVHSLKYRVTVRDAATGEVLDGPRIVSADIKAVGGVRALAEEQAGRTQRKVIIGSLASSIRTELTKPYGDDK